MVSRAVTLQYGSTVSANNESGSGLARVLSRSLQIFAAQRVDLNACTTSDVIVKASQVGSVMWSCPRFQARPV